MISDHIHVKEEHVFESLQKYFATQPPKSRFHRSGRRGQHDDTTTVFQGFEEESHQTHSFTI